MKKVVAIIISILIILGIMVVGLLSIIDDKQKISGDSLKFKEEYEILNGKYYSENNITATSVTIEKENPMIYLNDNNIIEKLTEGTHIVYFGYSESEWCRRTVPVLLEFAKTNMIDTIYYYNFANLENEYKKGNNANKIILYNDIVEILKDNIKSMNENDKQKLSAPTVFFIKDGEIVGSHYKLVESYKDYSIDLTEEQKKELLDIYQNYYDKMFANICEEDC